MSRRVWPLAAAIVMVLGMACRKEAAVMQRDDAEQVQAARKGFDVAEARRRALSALPEASSALAPQDLTPPFPAAWPPDGKLRVVYFAYAFAPQPTSQDLLLIYSPFARLELDLSARPDQPVRQIHLQTRPLHPLEPAEQDPGREAKDLEGAENALFAASVGKGLPSGSDAAAIRAGYEAWFNRHQALGEEMKRRFPEFVHWVERP